MVQALPWHATWLARTEGAAGPRTLVRATTRPPSPIVEVKTGDHYHTVLIEKHMLAEKDEQEQEDEDVKMSWADYIESAPQQVKKVM